MGLYYLPLLIRSDRYFIARLEKENSGSIIETDFDFVVHAEDRVLAPLLSIEDPDKVVLNQMAPVDLQDVLMRECQVSMAKTEEGFELRIKRAVLFQLSLFQMKQRVCGWIIQRSRNELSWDIIRTRWNLIPFLSVLFSSWMKKKFMPPVFILQSLHQGIATGLLLILEVKPARSGIKTVVRSLP